MTKRKYRTTLTPAQLSARASNAGRARTTPDHHIAKLADAAGDLTDEQARRLVVVLNLWASRDDEDGGGPRAA